MRKRRSSLLVIAVFNMGLLFAVSCTSDDFFEIEEDYEEVDYAILKEIALSKEYIDFQKQSYLMWNQMHSIDKTKRVVVNSYKGMTVYAYEETVSIKPFFDAREKLIINYPVFEETSNEEKNIILNLAILKNRSLRKMVESSLFDANITKSSSPESLAYRYAQSSEGLKINNHTWRLGGYGYWYTDDFYVNIINMAKSRVDEDGKEHGGYFFMDFSGLLNEDNYATPDSMHFYQSINSSNEEQPIQDFHFHPNDNLNPSLADYQMWFSVPWSEHLIFGKSSGVEQYHTEIQLID